MDILTSFILGAVQGLTEFIPVSSSGHLILARDLIGISQAGSLSFDAVLQLATSLAVLVYFRKDMFELASLAFSFLPGAETRKRASKESKILLSALVIGTIPAVVGGLLLEEMMETAFRSSLLVAVTLCAGSALMYFAEKYAKKSNGLTLANGFVVGCFQVLALIPGISRSGATISGGLLSGLSREEAARFSLLLSFPIIFGSGIKKLIEISADSLLITPLLMGSITAFFTGLLAIHFLLSYLRKHPLTVFIWYRLGLALLVLVFWVI